MAKSVLELAVGTGQWDAGLKKAKSALDNFTQSQGGLQQALDKESQKMQQFVRMMGQMDSTAKTAKGQMNDYKGTIEQLTMQYNRMTDAQKKAIGQDYLQAIDQMKQKYQAVNNEIQEMNRSLSGVSSPAGGGGGGLFSGDKISGMLQVFGGNLMTKGFEIATSAAMNFVSSIKEAAAQGIEMAKSGEGIRLAFDKLNDPSLLYNLREATHGTVADLELMKAAVKFNDFKLPLDQLGTMLAFAQQKAKDTGQSVDYMVDSIVTGLGRKSLMILDNLGLSAAQIKDKMKDTGDMTTAVGAIIREQMSSAGDYVETAADRATRADVDLKNAMEDLGRTLLPLEEQGVGMWNALEIGALKLLNDGIKPLVPALLDLKVTISDIASEVSDSSIWNTYVEGIKTVADQAARSTPILSGFYNLLQAIRGNHQDMGAGVGDISGAFINYGEVTSIPEVTVTGNKPKKTKTGSKTPKTEEQENNEQIQKLTQEYIKASQERQAAIRDEIKTLQDRNNVIQQLKDEALGKAKIGGISAVEGATPMSGENPLEKYKDSAIGLVIPLQQLQNELKNLQALQAAAWSPEVFAAYEKRIQEVQGEMNVFRGMKSSSEDMAKSWRVASSAINSVGSAMSGLKNPTINIMTAIGQAIATIGLAYAETLAKDATSKTNIYSFIAAAASATISLATTIAQFHSATGYANGGIVKGNSYSGDNIPAMIDGGAGGFAGLNAGEVVLNASMQNMLAQNLQGSGGGNFHLVGRLAGEDIIISAERAGQRMGYGQLMFWKGN